MDASSAEQRFLIQVIATKLSIQIAQDRVVFNVWCIRSWRAPEGTVHKNGMANIKSVAEIARISEVVTCGNCRGIGGGKSWKKSMAVGKINTMRSNPKHRGGVYGVDRTASQAIGNKNNDITGMNGLSIGLAGKSGRP